MYHINHFQLARGITKCDYYIKVCPELCLICSNKIKKKNSEIDGKFRKGNANLWFVCFEVLLDRHRNRLSDTSLQPRPS